MPRVPFAIALCSVLLAACRAEAVVEAEMPLAQLVRDSQVVATAKLEQIDRDTGKGMLMIQRVLRGNEPPKSIPIKLVATAGGEGSPRDLLDRVEDGTSLMLFVSQLSPTEHQVFAYSSGSWFKLRGVDTFENLKVVFLQGEPYLRRTFHGEVPELVKLLDDFIAGTGKLPEIDKTAKPGLGPILHDSPAMPEVVAVATDQVELGPAWQADGTEVISVTASHTYAAGWVLLVAAVGLLFMLTRSSPGASS